MVTKGNRGLVEKQKLLKSRRGEKLKKIKDCKKSQIYRVAKCQLKSYLDCGNYYVNQIKQLLYLLLSINVDRTLKNYFHN